MSHPILEQFAERVLSVTEYLDLINELIAPLRVAVEGEVTELKILREWVFFSLKDAESGALLRCGLHAQAYRRLGVNVEEGMRIKAVGYGKLSPKSGNFGFWVSAIEPVGEGALRRAYELLVKKLAEEGLFARKREMPECISHIGVISSRDGVVLQDLRHNLMPLGIRIDFLHSSVEGAASAEDLVRAIEYFSQTKDAPDVLVLIRGGGSLESLQGFNNEAVCRALFAASMPVLVGIGHDVDAPIATMIADVSVSTPTAVATAINNSWAVLTEDMPRYAERVASLFSKRMRVVEHRSELALRTMRYGVSRVFTAFRRYEDALERAGQRMNVRFKEVDITASSMYTAACQQVARRLTRITQAVREYERVLAAADPTRILSRGYTLTYGVAGTLVRSVTDAKPGDTLKTRLKDGTLISVVSEREKEY